MEMCWVLWSYRLGGDGSRWSERGSGVVEWLGISALSIGVLVAIFAALEGLGLDLIAAIRSQLGV